MDDLNEPFDETEISKYEEKHRPQNQKFKVDGFCINPLQRPDFDVTPNDYRDGLEVHDWWGRPYIIEDEYWQPDDNYETYAERCKGLTTIPLETKDQWEKRQAENRQDFVNKYPSGKSYTVRCLHGGAWDRSSWCGTFATLSEAIDHAKNIDGEVYTGTNYQYYLQK